MISHNPVGFVLGMQDWINVQKLINAIHFINKLKVNQTEVLTWAMEQEKKTKIYSL